MSKRKQSGVWAVTLVLHKQDGPQLRIAHSLFIHHGAASEDEAKGRSITQAMKESPGHSVASVISTEVETP